MTHATPNDAMPNPFQARTDQQTFYAYPAWSQRLHMITRLFDGPSRLLLVIGERGSGKTLMMQQFLAQDEKNWKSCRINAHDETDPPADEKVRAMTEHRAYMHSGREWPVVMMDEAHTLSPAELTFLIRLTGIKGYQRQLGKLVLFGESILLAHVSELSGLIPEAGAVEKVFMPHMTMAETTTYLNRRINASNGSGTSLFTASDIERIQEESGGFPGLVNQAAARLFEKKQFDGGRLKSFFKQLFS
jgi:type II secretory pathway predicted ATPase ExeA